MRARIDPAGYVLGTLSEKDLERARRLEADDPGFAAEVAELRAVMGRLDALEADEWGPAPPPPLRIEEIVPAATLARARSAESEDVPGERRRWYAGIAERLSGGSIALSPALAAVVAALLVAGGLGGGLLLSSGGGDGAPAGETIALQRYGDGPEGASARAQISDTGDTREVRIDASGLRPSGEGEFYEVWLIKDAERMVSLGSFRVGEDGRADVELPVNVDPADYPTLDVSIEPADGTPTHSGTSVLRADDVRGARA